MRKSPNILAKTQAAIKWTNERGFNFLITDAEINFEQIKQLYISGQIIPQERYKERFDKNFLILSC